MAKVSLGVGVGLTALGLFAGTVLFEVGLFNASSTFEAIRNSVAAICLGLLIAGGGIVIIVKSYKA